MISETPQTVLPFQIANGIAFGCCSFNQLITVFKVPIESNVDEFSVLILLYLFDLL
jgi:hypothetical protein